MPYYLGTTKFGTTSACAENTCSKRPSGRLFGNYLRVRGEYRRRGHQKAEEAELPPRARRIPAKVWLDESDGGTTSACAENTTIISPTTSEKRNYLRVRGEYCCQESFHSPQPELPPRARRIHHLCLASHQQIGTTSACAENTRKLLTSRYGRRNYLRVRGEYCSPA